MHGTSAKESLGSGLRDKCRDLDRPIAGLLNDLQQRGLLEDTLVVWGASSGVCRRHWLCGGGRAYPRT